MKFVVRGGNTLKGEIEVGGAKNFALPALDSCLLFSNPLSISNLPLIEDVFRTIELLHVLGVKTERKGERGIVLDSRGLHGHVLKKEIAERLRASIVLAGTLFARNKKVAFPYPGGCVLGKRPVDMFLEGWKRMGAVIKEGSEGFSVSARTLRGCDFTFRKTSVTATETLMFDAVLAKGRTILRNAAREPEVQVLAEFLNENGADIRGAGTSFIEIRGRNGRLLTAKKPLRVIPDRIEAGSFLMLGAALARKLRITRCNPDYLSVVIEVLREAGVPVRTGKDWIEVGKGARLKSIDMKTSEYPGFPTDLQAPFAMLMTQAEGQSMIFETIFDGRLNYIEELNRMGAKIVPCDPHRILVHGPTPLHGRTIESPDLRAGLAFIIAALVAKGRTEIGNIYQIDRGYERIDERLRELGADIERK